MTDFASMLQPDRGQPARTIHVVEPDAYESWLAKQSQRIRTTIAAHRLTGKPGDRAVLPGETADDWSMLLVCNEAVTSPWRIASLGASLPAGTYRLAEGPVGAAGLGWMLAQHQFTRYVKPDAVGLRILLTADAANIDETVRLAEATALVRDLVNTGASDMGPADLEAAAETLAKRHGATVTTTRGDALATGYPMIHAVGQAASKDRAPRLIELEWGDPSHPRIALVGKGVTFDTGGLDIKPSAGMRLMKKDMGGAAHALALASLVMAAKLPVRLHPRGGKLDRRQRLPPRRRAPDTQGPDGREHQHRRGRSPCPRRRADESGREQSRTDPRLRDADWRSARRARPRPAADVDRRRAAGGGPARIRAGTE
jgi:hypothetical protein